MREELLAIKRITLRTQATWMLKLETLHREILFGQRVTCLYHEDLENYLWVCKHNEYKSLTWVKVILCKDNLFLACCYIPHRESNYYNLYQLDPDGPYSSVCVDILTSEKIVVLMQELKLITLWKLMIL